MHEPTFACSSPAPCISQSTVIIYSARTIPCFLSPAIVPSTEHSEVGVGGNEVEVKDVLQPHEFIGMLGAPGVYVRVMLLSVVQQQSFYSEGGGKEGNVILAPDTVYNSLQGGNASRAPGTSCNSLYIVLQQH
eukprot:scaffold266016_cov22-Tisochrysis_lutea.AAC.1